MIRTFVIAAAAMLAVLAATAVSAPPAEAASKRVCARTASVRDTPRGFVIARLRRGQRVVVVRRSAARGWTHVRTPSGLPGWVLNTSLCKTKGRRRG